MTIPLSLLVLHFVGDFLLQSDWMALNKSKQWRPLLLHTVVYSSCFIWFGLGFSVTTFFLHTATDYVTSRITSRLWFIDLNLSEAFGHTLVSAKVNAGKRHWFFTMIGLDQLIHFVTLAVTYRWLVG